MWGLIGDCPRSFSQIMCSIKHNYCYHFTYSFIQQIFIRHPPYLRHFSTVIESTGNKTAEVPALMVLLHCRRGREIITNKKISRRAKCQNENVI